MPWIMRAISENSFDRRIVPVPHLKHLQYDRLRIKSNVFSVSSLELHLSLLCERKGMKYIKDYLKEDTDLNKKTST